VGVVKKAEKPAVLSEIHFYTYRYTLTSKKN